VLSKVNYSNATLNTMKAASAEQEDESDYRVCLSIMGSQSREIVSIGTADTLEDVHKMAMKIIGKENIELRTGFPPRPLIISTVKAQMVLERNERVQVIEVQAASIIQNNDPDATARREKRQRTEEEWACSRCTLLNASSNHACEVCGAENDSNIDHPFSNLPQESSTDPPPPLSPSVAAVSLGLSNRDPPPSLPSQITIISFNVAGFQPSQAATSRWDPLTHFRSAILKQSPDVVCLQEVPYGAWDFLPGYECVGSCESHCLRVVLLIKNEWASYCGRVSHVEAPAVLGRLTFASGASLLLGSCHFAPFADGASARMQQMQKVLHHRKASDSRFCLAGDFNMRVKEDQKFEALGLRDAWKDTGALHKEKNTWDSCDRTQRGAVAGTGPHNAYHGTEAFQFACRFDRIYLSGDNLTTRSFRLFANKPLTNPFHYLSDHFGMAAKLNIKE
jgi:endonuclease/exonuclease/phosphatase family metal-dependent hydrolase